MEKKPKGKYQDIINLPHHVSKTHPQMPLYDRAAQFSPFAALTGYEDAIRETARLTDNWVQLSEDKKQELDEKLRQLIADRERTESVTIIYFQPDDRKEGGSDLRNTIRGGRNTGRKSGFLRADCTSHRLG